ncbi:Pre-mRNA-splicing factor of RES complex-domain-containing protein [Xylariales sp. PMI_506]|nr:Pre-mRNA-splicing factor of RES complex-domain-containing protein [Xylariales sp. PMI_506]
MPSDLSSYLATHYLTADPKPSKKRKRKQNDPSSGLLITDDSETSWGRTTNTEDADEHASAMVAGTSAEFRKAKQSAWKVVGAPIPKEAGGDDSAAADAIVASAAAESAEAGGGDNDVDEAPAVLMSDGTHAGLQSAATVAAQLARRKRAEEAEFAKMRRHEKEAETVYRDATGRRVDAGMKRAEARRLAAEAADKEQAAKEALKGDVQVQEAARRRERLEDAKLMAVARRADDEDMNRELKAQTRWGDTMAEFIGKDKGDAVAGRAGKKSLKGRPVYQGATPPNRYGIRPGYRWDGVDRGNGFEAQRFKAINRVERNKDLDYNWQMDE